MIRVNLSGAPKKKGKGASASTSAPGPSRALPLLLVLIVVASAVGGYYWYSRLNGITADVNQKIAQKTDERDKLAAIIKQDQIYEKRKKALEARISVIESLKKSQVSPVRSLDILDDAIDRTKYVWLTSLDQKETIFTMAGTGTSVNAIADFVSNLEATGYFKNVNLQNATDASGNYTFSMTCEFALPEAPAKEAN
ncbi:MAG TPA: PilN domain-containing protein [Terriglobia bacterium]|nr:PilN domain-containing protein [Terriglobia bacterium]